MCSMYYVEKHSANKTTVNPCHPHRDFKALSYSLSHMSLVLRKPVFGVPTTSDTN